MPKKNLRHYPLKKLEEELNSINEKISEAVDRYCSFHQGMESASNSMRKFKKQKDEIRAILRDKKFFAKNVRSIIRIKRLLKK